MCKSLIAAWSLPNLLASSRPSGWWHLVVNLDFSIAVTQNYVSSIEVSITIHQFRLPLIPMPD